ncbi:MAG: MoaD/ThiS family protein, partial [Betaproteobacteria bacterium]
MKVVVLYFARLREAVGHDREELELPPQVATVAQLRAWLIARGEPWAVAFTEIK